MLAFALRAFLMLILASIVTGCLDIDQQALIDSEGELTFSGKIHFGKKLSELAGDSPPPICERAVNGQNDPPDYIKSYSIKAHKKNNRWVCQVEFVVPDIRSLKNRQDAPGPLRVSALGENSVRIEYDLNRSRERFSDSGEHSEMAQRFAQALGGDHYISLAIEAPRIGETNGKANSIRTKVTWRYSLASIVDEGQTIPRVWNADIHFDVPWYRRVWSLMTTSLYD